MLMDAIVKPSRAPGLELVRKEVPKIEFGEALIKIHYTAICGTDVHIYDWNDWAEKTINPPLTIGHEFVGEIVEIKGFTDSFKVGDIVKVMVLEVDEKRHRISLTMKGVPKEQ